MIVAGIDNEQQGWKIVEGGYYYVDTPPVVSLISPANNASISPGTSITLDWSATDIDPGDVVSEYELRAGTSSGGSDLKAVATQGLSTSYLFTLPTANNTVYWAVRAKDKYGVWSGWKESQFTLSSLGDMVYGDVSGDQVIDVGDAMLILQREL